MALSTTVEDLLAVRKRLRSWTTGLTSSERNLAAGALEHALALASGDAAHLITAFEHTEAALAEDPSSRAGLFNRAIIASDLGLCRFAARSWRQYLAREPASDWATEATARLSLLPCEDERPDRDSSPDALISYAIGTLVPSSLKARQQGLPAEHLVRSMVLLGEELHARTGDPMIRELAEEMMTATDEEHVTAFAACIRGRVLLDDEQYGQARSELQRAGKTLRAGRSCLAPWADIWLARIDLYDGRFQSAEERLANLAEVPEVARSRYLSGRLLWASGLAAARAGRLQAAYDRIARAEEEFRHGGCSITAASMQTLRAETLTHLGFEREAWTPRSLPCGRCKPCPAAFGTCTPVSSPPMLPLRGAESLCSPTPSWWRPRKWHAPSGARSPRPKPCWQRAEVSVRAAPDEFGIRHLDSVQDIFDDAIDAALAANEPLRALELLEAARRGAATKAGEPAAVAGLSLVNGSGVDAKAEGPVIVVFGLTPRTFAWWLLDGEQIRSGWHGASRVEALVRSAEWDSSQPLRPDALARLYEVLLAEALEDVPRGRPLIIVPDGILQRVPFAALREPDTGVRLIQRRAISFQTGLAAAREQSVETSISPRSKWTVVAVGDPAFDRGRLPLGRLPAAAVEAERVAALYEGGRLLTGAAATAQEIRRALVSAAVLHVASHATAGRGPSDSALVLAADPDAESSGLASVEEILPSANDLQLVVLSGCSTLGVKPSRSGGLLGLARAFSTRGVPATLGTLWKLDDQLLSELMTDFHHFVLEGHSAAEALRRAQLAYLADPSRPCCDWAALQLIGDLPAEGSVQLGHEVARVQQLP